MTSETEKPDNILEKAIQQYFADQNDGALMTGYAVIITGMNIQSDGSRQMYSTMVPDTQPIHESYGLLTVFHNMIDEDEDDD